MSSKETDLIRYLRFQFLLPTPSTDEFSLQTTPWRNISVLICLNVNTSWLSIIYGLGFSRCLFPECELRFIKMEREEQVLKTEWCHFMSLLLLINQMVNVKWSCTAWFLTPSARRLKAAYVMTAPPEFNPLTCNVFLTFVFTVVTDSVLS